MNTARVRFSQSSRRTLDPGSQAVMDLDGARRSALLRRASDGDHAAFADFYDDTVADAISLARTLLSSERLAQIVIERSFHEVWRGSARFDQSSDDAMAWLLALVRLNAVREKHRIRADHDDLTEQGVIDERH